MDQKKKQEKSNENIIRLQNKNAIEQDSSHSEETDDLKGEEENNVNLGQGRSDLISTDESSIKEKNTLNSTETKETDEDPRRKRRRSSASA